MCYHIASGQIPDSSRNTDSVYLLYFELSRNIVGAIMNKVPPKFYGFGTTPDKHTDTFEYTKKSSLLTFSDNKKKFQLTSISSVTCFAAVL